MIPIDPREVAHRRASYLNAIGPTVREIVRIKMMDCPRIRLHPDGRMEFLEPNRAPEVQRYLDFLFGFIADERRRIIGITSPEIEDARAKLAERYDPVSALDAACRASGIPLADDYERRLAEWRAYLDAPVDPDSTLYRAIAADPKAYPPEKP